MQCLYFHPISTKNLDRDGENYVSISQCWGLVKVGLYFICIQCHVELIVACTGLTRNLRNFYLSK